MIHPTTINDLCDAVRTLPWVRVRGGGTKSAISAGATLSMAQLSGILEYNPSEFTFTALAGTRLSEVRQALAEHGQYLPFDPPWVDTGATLGGTVAAGLSGSGRMRFGGVRDFLLGAKFVSGDGQLVRTGGKVVKNAAGFDIPKLMVGSRGRFGVLAELSFKVFPRPAATATLCVDFSGSTQTQNALAAMERLARSQFELSALDFGPPGRLWLRLGGLADAMPARLARLGGSFDGAATATVFTDDAAIWRDVTEFAWVPVDCVVVKLPITPGDIQRLEKELAPLTPRVGRRYCVGGNVAWLAWPEQLSWQPLSEISEQLGRTPLVVRGRLEQSFIAPVETNAFLDRLIAAFDPQGKFTLQPAVATA